LLQPAVSKHLKVLERAGLISRGRDAQRRPSRLEATPLAEATAWLEGYRRFWEDSFQNLDALLDELKTEQTVLESGMARGVAESYDVLAELLESQA
jgi:DNA-binding transcriptional ArsR family regulator